MLMKTVQYVHIGRTLQSVLSKCDKKSLNVCRTLSIFDFLMGQLHLQRVTVPGLLCGHQNPELHRAFHRV